VLFLISGELEMILEMDGGERRIPLKAGEAFIVPRGIWHRALVREPGQLIGITRGWGTEHRPI
jgi:mannose-6-phosphate isomerase-like protein (cupin superfamily)